MTGRTCPRLWQVEALRDGRISGSEAASARSHIDRCAACRRETEELEALSRDLASSAPPDAMTIRRLRNIVLARADAALRSARPVRQWSWLLVPAVAVAVLAVRAWVVHRPAGRATEPRDFATISADGARFTRKTESGVELVDLADGTLSVSTRLKPSGWRFVVHVPDGEIEDVGTVFKVTVQAGSTREISVTEGSIVFRRPNVSEIRLSSGSVWSAPSAMEPPIASVVPLAQLPESVATPVLSPQTRRTEPPRAEKPKVNGSSGDPTGTLPAEDESYLRIVALLREHRAEEARMAAMEYLRRFPDGFRRAEVERLTRAPSER